MTHHDRPDVVHAKRPKRWHHHRRTRTSARDRSCIKHHNLTTTADHVHASITDCQRDPFKNRWIGWCTHRPRCGRQQHHHAQGPCTHPQHGLQEQPAKAPQRPTKHRSDERHPPDHHHDGGDHREQRGQWTKHGACHRTPRTDRSKGEQRDGRGHQPRSQTCGKRQTQSARQRKHPTILQRPAFRPAHRQASVHRARAISKRKHRAVAQLEAHIPR